MKVKNQKPYRQIKNDVSDGTNIGLLSV